MLIRTTISQNLRTPRKFFLVVLVLVLVLDWVSGLDYEDEDDDEDDSAAAAPLRTIRGSKNLNGLPRCERICARRENSYA